MKTIFYSLELTSKQVSRYHDHHGFCYFWTLAAWRRFQCNLDLRLQTLEVDDALHPSFMLCRTWFLMFFFISNICLLEGIVSVICICSKKKLSFWTTTSWLQVRRWEIFVRNGFPLDEIRKVRRSMLMSLLLPDAIAALDPRQQVTAAMQKAICLPHGDFFDFSKTILEAFHRFGRTACLETVSLSQLEELTDPEIYKKVASGGGDNIRCSRQFPLATAQCRESFASTVCGVVISLS